MAATKRRFLIFGIFVVALVLAIILRAALKQKALEQSYGLMLSPEDVKTSCGKPQVDDIYTLTYVNGVRRVKLEFLGVNHRMYLNKVKWDVQTNGQATFNANGGLGDISQVTRDLINEHVKAGNLPACLGEAAR